MRHASYSDLRQNLARYMDEVCDSRAPLYVTRQNARSIVMISQEEYEGMVETLYLLRSPANAKRLRRATADATAGKLKKRKLTDPPAPR